MTAEMDWTIRPLIRTDNRRHFDCGEPAFNDYLQKFAHQHALRNISQTHVAVFTYPHEQIIGFYTLSSGGVDFQLFPAPLQKKLPKYPVPIIRIGRLAVDKSMHGRGVGDNLLMDQCH